MAHGIRFSRTFREFRKLRSLEHNVFLEGSGVEILANALLPDLLFRRSMAGEADAATKGKGKGGKTEKGKGEKSGDQRDRNTLLVEAALKPQILQKEVLSEEQLESAAAMAKEYSRLKMAEHRLQRAGESARLKLKMAAIAALPAGQLQDAAMVPDLTPFPAGRMAPTLTPPLMTSFEEREQANMDSAPVRKSR